MIRTAIQFIATLAAAMLGEYLMCRLLRFPGISQPRFWIAIVFWSTATLGYLIPRDLTPSLRTRILSGLLAVAALAASRAWLAWHLRFPIEARIILAPLTALIVFYITAFVTAPPRPPGILVMVLLAGVVAQFFSMWWSLGFETDSGLRFTAAEVIPFAAATIALLVTDNLTKTGDNPTMHLDPSSNSRFTSV